MAFQFKFSGHFSSIGWTPDRYSNEILWFPGRQLEAIKINSEKNSILCKAWSDTPSEDMHSDNEGIAGTVGQKKPLYAVAFEFKTAEERNYNICYRVCLKNIGWTRFFKDGEVCGNLFSNNEFPIEGIQIVILEDNINEDEAMALADKSLSRYTSIMDHLFVREPENLLMACTKNYLLPEKTAYQEIENGYILPLKQTTASTRNGMYAGGVLDSEGNFVSGFDRKNGIKMNYTCLEGYPIEDCDVIKLDETVIFGGVFIKHFGHLFAECLSRLWYIIEHENEDYPIVVLAVPGHEDFAKDFFELLGVHDQRIQILNRPTQYAKVIVPEQAVHLWAGYHDKISLVYNKLIDSSINAISQKYEKIYLTRTEFNKPDSVNEAFFDTFFEKKGYKVIAPETYTIQEQIALLANAKEVICTEGTLSHLALFCMPSTKFIIFRRDDTSVLIPQMVINQAKNMNIYYIDVTYNFLPTKHDNGQYLYGPTSYFVEFLKNENIPYMEEEVEFDLSQYCYPYLEQWCKHYNILKNFNEISGQDIFDVLSRMNRILGEKKISRSQYKTKTKQKEADLIEENKKLKEKIKKLEKK